MSVYSGLKYPMAYTDVDIVLSSVPETSEQIDIVAKCFSAMVKEELSNYTESQLILSGVYVVNKED